MLLDSRDFPRDKTCGSGLSPRAIEILNELEIWEAVEPISEIPRDCSRTSESFAPLLE